MCSAVTVEPDNDHTRMDSVLFADTAGPNFRQVKRHSHHSCKPVWGRGHADYHPLIAFPTSRIVSWYRLFQAFTVVISSRTINY